MLICDESVTSAAPGAHVGLLAVRSTGGAPLGALPPDPDAGEQAIARLRERWGGFSRAELKQQEPIAAYVEYYRRFGQSYHLLGQVESLLQGKRGFSAASALLATVFAWELETMLLTAVHDLARLQLPLRLEVAAGDEVYRSISDRDVTAVAGDLLIRDGAAPISSILRGPDLGSRVTESTAEALFTVYAPAGVPVETVRAGLETLTERLATATGAERTLLQVVPAAAED